MMEIIFFVAGYSVVLIFGIILSIDFSGAERTRENLKYRIALTVVTLIIQTVFGLMYGNDFVRQLYPIFMHLPIVLLLKFPMKVNLLSSVVSVLAVFLCYQVPHLIAETGESLFGQSARLMFYVPALILMFYFARKYMRKPISEMLKLPTKYVMMFGAVPALYYVFLCATGIYTDILYSGAMVVVRFLPATLSVFFFMFVLIYYRSLEQRQKAQEETMMLSMQAEQAKRELEMYSQTAGQAAIYRHDMRHHLALISTYLEKGESTKAMEYIKQTGSDIEKFTPVRYCQNDMVNMILSAFVKKGQKAGASVTIDAKLPKTLDFPETELCTLIANSLENAVNAAGKAAHLAKTAAVNVSLQIHKGNLLLQIENSYSGEIEMKGELPISSQQDHGFGVKSIVLIVEKHKGYYSFEPDADSHIFTTKIVLPLGDLSGVAQ